MESFHTRDYVCVYIVYRSAYTFNILSAQDPCALLNSASIVKAQISGTAAHYAFSVTAQTYWSSLEHTHPHGKQPVLASYPAPPLSSSNTIQEGFVNFSSALHQERGEKGLCSQTIQ